MKTFLIFALTSIFLVSCEAPRDRRAVFTDAVNPGTGPTATATGTYPYPTGTPGPTSTIPPHLSHCGFTDATQNSFRNSHAHIGSYTACKETGSNRVHIQFQTAHTDAQVCLFPTYNSGSNVFHIGEPRCVHATTAFSIYPVDLYINRTGFTSYPITGVMIMKDKSFFYPWPYNSYLYSPDAYVQCEDWLYRTGDPSYCNTFNVVGEYVYHQF